MCNPAQTYSYTYDPDNRLATANGGGTTLISPAVAGTGSLTMTGGPDQVNVQQICVIILGQCHYTPIDYYDYGVVTAQIGTASYSANYSENSTTSLIASALATAINSDSSAPVTATASGATINLIAKATGSFTDYPLSVSSVTTDTQYFSKPSFGGTASGSSLTGGANGVYSGAGVLSETYTVDPWGNQQESGNFNFQQSFAANNRLNLVNGYSYDSAGDLLTDGSNTYAYNAEGMLTSTNGAQYTYDAMDQRVEKTGGSNPTEVIYFNGHPIALLNATSGAWTDLIWAGGSMIAEVAGTQTAVPVYRLLDHEGSLVATTDGSGNVTGTNLMSPYGETLSSNTSDPYSYTGLYRDTEYGGDDAWYRNYSTEQTRWLTPDPYNGSYDLTNPQSFNRYMYVNGNPLMYTDPSGKDPFTFYVLAICGGAPGTCASAGINPVTAVVLGGLLAGAELGDLLGLWGGPQFHGSLQPRPNGQQSNCTGVPQHPPGASASSNLSVAQQATNGMDPVSKLGYVDQTFQTGGAFDYKTMYGGAGWGIDSDQFVDYGNWNFGYVCGGLGYSGLFCQSAAGANRMYRASMAGQNPFTSGTPFIKKPYGDQAPDNQQIQNGYNAQSSGCAQ